MVLLPSSPNNKESAGVSAPAFSFLAHAYLLRDTLFQCVVATATHKKNHYSVRCSIMWRHTS